MVTRHVPLAVFTVCVTVVVIFNVASYRNCNDDDTAVTVQSVTEVLGVSDAEKAEVRVPNELRSEEQLTAHEDSEESGTRLVIIATESRSGSTWLGTIFQMLPDLMYVFEPLDARHAGGKGYPSLGKGAVSGKMLTADSQLKVLSSLCTCKFRTIQAFGKAISGRTEMSSKTEYNLAEHVAKGPDHMEEFCSEFSIVMPKCIRLTDISILQRLPEYNCTNYQVVHLIRDPRAVIRSRMVTFHELYAGNTHKTPEMTDEMIGDAAKDLCSHGLQNSKIAAEPWFNDRYYRVRYEDIVDHPHEQVEALYNYIKKKVTEDVTKFITSSMSGKSTASNYNVVKDSKAVAEKWRSMEVDKIRIIESACRDFLKTFGYEIFEEESLR